jgi:hypothetical protein
MVDPEKMAVATKSLDKHVPLAMNIHVTIEELLDVMFSMKSASHQILSYVRYSKGQVVPVLN